MFAVCTVDTFCRHKLRTLGELLIFENKKLTLPLRDKLLKRDDKVKSRKFGTRFAT